MTGARIAGQGRITEVHAGVRRGTITGRWQW